MRRLSSIALGALALTTFSTLAAAQQLTGAGSTFAYPIYSKWADAYAGKTGVKINYQSIGSGGGIRQLSEQTVDFGATDAPMSDAQIAGAKGGPVMHFPTVMGAVVITYNLPGVTTPLKLTGDVIAKIYLGQITRWNDAALVGLNPGVSLPNSDIIVVHRTDGSGTTFIFSDFLSGASPAWAQQVGKGTELKWPVGLGGKGSEGVSGQVKQIEGAIGYVELSYANQNKLPSALVRNPAGVFIAPSIQSVTDAAAGVVAKLPTTSDYRISIVNAPGKTAYPISSFTWIVVYTHQTDATKGRQLVDFLRWAYANGESMASSLDYAPLPAVVSDRLLKRLGQIQVAAQ